MLHNMFCLKSRWLLILLCLCIGFASLQSGAVQQAAAQTVNPTPIIISLTPQATATPALGHDSYEPNNEPSQASGVGAQTLAGLTLPAGDIDYFALLLPAGHTVTAETIVQGSLDTQLTLWVNGQLVASNDNKGGSDAGSRVVYTAAGDVTIILLVEPLAGTSGRYDLQLSLLAPTATPQPPATATLEPTPTQQILPTATQPPTATPFPTATPIPTNTPLPPPTATAIVWPTATSQPIWPTATPQPVWPTHTPTAQTLAAAPTVPTATPLPASGGSAASSESVALIPLSPTVMAAVSITAVPTSALDVGTTPEVTSTLEVTPTITVSTTAVAISTTGVVTTAVGPALTLERIGRIPTPTPEAATHIRLLIYYDANNDRAPGPTEGISNVSVLAVNDHGQQLAHLFTNRQGEAVFTLTSADASRLIVPFVPSWSARIQPSQHNDTVVLGLPAVRLPVFLPVQPAVDPDRPR